MRIASSETKKKKAFLWRNDGTIRGAKWSGKLGENSCKLQQQQ